MNSAPQTRGIGTQLVLEPGDIEPPDYELMDWQVDETISELLDRAVEIGEQVSQANIARGRGPAPYAHRACTAYHAIEIIAMYKQWYETARAEAAELRERLDEINSAAEDRRFE